MRQECLSLVSQKITVKVSVRLVLCTDAPGVGHCK